MVRRKKLSITDPVPADMLTELVRSCAVVVIGVGDCGSCSASAVADGIAFETEGVRERARLVLPELVDLLTAAAADGERLAHLGRTCTVEQAAANAAMAGCRPEYLPVVLAAWDALMQQRVVTGGGAPAGRRR